jgi:hypothetical protein
MAKYKVTLTKKERTELEAILSKGYHTGYSEQSDPFIPEQTDPSIPKDIDPSLFFL